MANWSMCEHRLSILQLAECYPRSHININSPSDSLGLHSLDAEYLLKQFGPNQITIRKRKRFYILCCCSHSQTIFIHTPYSAVRRDGQLEFQMRETRSLVPGDIIHVMTNDMIPADCRILTCSEGDNPFQIAYTGLTSENYMPPSLTNNVDLSDNDPIMTKNLCFGGTTVVHGEATLLVCRTGKHSLMQSLAPLLG